MDHCCDQVPVLSPMPMDHYDRFAPHAHTDANKAGRLAPQHPATTS
jgi:hypothetical protein